MTKEEAIALAKALRCETVREAREKLSTAIGVCEAVRDGYLERLERNQHDSAACQYPGALRFALDTLRYRFCAIEDYDEPEQDDGALTYAGALARAMNYFGRSGDCNVARNIRRKHVEENHETIAREFRQIADALERGPHDPRDENLATPIDEFLGDVKDEKGARQ